MTDPATEYDCPECLDTKVNPYKIAGQLDKYEPDECPYCSDTESQNATESLT